MENWIQFLHWSGLIIWYRKLKLLHFGWYYWKNIVWVHFSWNMSGRFPLSIHLEKTLCPCSGILCHLQLHTTLLTTEYYPAVCRLIQLSAVSLYLYVFMPQEEHPVCLWWVSWILVLFWLNAPQACLGFQWPSWDYFLASGFFSLSLSFLQQELNSPPIDTVEFYHWHILSKHVNSYSGLCTPKHGKYIKRLS